MVPIPKPGFPFLASDASTQASYLLSLEAKKNRPTPLLGGSRLRYWLHPSLTGAHLIRGWVSKPLPIYASSLVVQRPTIASIARKVPGSYVLCFTYCA